MENYKYIGSNIHGKKISGIIQSISQETATQKLQNDGIIVISIEKSLSTSEVGHLFSKLFQRKPNLQDLLILSKQLYSLTKAAIPITRAIKVVAESSKNEILKEALTDVAISIESGLSLSKALSRHPNIFPRLMLALVNVGENTGALEEVFLQLSFHFEREDVTIKRVKSATRYPTFVISTIGVAMIIINMVVIPAFSKFFAKFNAELPLPTKILIATSHAFVNYWYLIFGGLIGLIIAWSNYIKTEPGMRFWHRAKLYMPIFGNIVEKGLLSRFVRSFGLALKTGVPLLDAIFIVAKTANNLYVEEKILEMSHNIERGESLVVSAKKTQMFTPLVLQMIAIGEETGEVDRLLKEVGDFYDQELEYDLKLLGDYIEPVLISIIAVMVLILALGIFLPMWELSQVNFVK